MVLHFNVTKDKRKAMVQAIEKEIGGKGDIIETIRNVDAMKHHGKHLDMIRYYPTIHTEEAAILKIFELLENLHDVEAIGKVPENVSAELVLREFDPKQEIYNEEERSLIRECVVQMKDMCKAKDLAGRICHAEESGSQELSLVVSNIRKKLENLQAEKRNHVKKIER